MIIKRAVGLLRDVRAKGLREGMQHGGHRISEAFHEWRWGIHTAGVISPVELGYTDSEDNEYCATAYATLIYLFSRVSIDPDRDVFLDYGCGMGRAIIVAATYPFHRIIGIERSTRLAQIARENVARVRGRLACDDIQVVTMDATLYRKLDDVTVIVFYNSFVGSVLSRVVANIQESVRDHPRELSIICVNHRECDAQVSEAGWIVKQEEFGFYPRTGGAIYRCTGTGSCSRDLESKNQPGSRDAPSSRWE